MTLVKDGSSAATIVLADKPTRAAQLAAFEIQEHVRQITGASLPIVGEDAEGDGIKLFVGKSKAASVAGVPDDFKDQEYAVLFKPNAIIMAGNDKQDFGKVSYWHAGNPQIEGAYDYLSWPELYDEKGTLHAAYDFLEKYCGVRWFDQSEFGTDVPKTRTLTVTARDLRRSPAFRYRGVSFFKNNFDTFDRFDREESLWTIRWNESTPKYQEWLDLIYEKGRKLPVCSHPHRWLYYERSHVFAFLTRSKIGGEAFEANHSFYRWYDRFWEKNPDKPDIFVEKKADWFAKGYPDAKVPPQLCYSNPEVVQQCLDDARKFFALPEEERGKSRAGTDKFFPVVPMDNTSYCKCPRCSKFGPAERVHPEYSSGDHSARVWSFVNEIARGLKKSNPDKMVSALAYSSYAHRPSGMKIEDNIAVRMCLFPHAAATSPEMLKNDDEILKEWADGGSPLYLWLYTGLTTGPKPQVPMFPRPMGDLWGALLQKYRQAGVCGILADNISQETDAYLLLKLVDDPAQDSGKLIDDYFVRMYGSKAGATLKKFYKLAESIYANPRNYPKGIDGPELYYGILGTESNMKKLGELVQQAENDLSDAPELWKKRFAIFKFGVWNYMKEGRAQYEKNKVVKASASMRVECPIMLNVLPDVDPGRVDWRDAQGVGGLNGWLKDSGDVSLREISGIITHDTKYLYLNLTESNLNRKPDSGDSWEIVMRNSQTDAAHRLFIDASGKITGQVVAVGGVPQEWSDHGVKAQSKVSEKDWIMAFVFPIQDKFLNKQGCLFMNCRRNDKMGEDSPVLVATGNDFESGKTGVLISFDKALSGQLQYPPVKDLIMDLDFSGNGKILKDRSGHGNDGVIMENAKRLQNGIEFTDGGQYLEVQKLKGFNPENYTFSCWLKYSDSKRKGGLRVFTSGTFRGDIALPYQKVILLDETTEGKVTGAGPFGAEFSPDTWHMFTITCVGKLVSVYENGRDRGGLKTDRFKTLDVDATWCFGGGPKFRPWQTFLGKLSQIQFYGRALSPEEIMGKYQGEYPQYRRNHQSLK
ncbi:MAG: DUF4838 domain-containing protein [Victivallales bacterium]